MTPVRYQFSPYFHFSAGFRLPNFHFCILCKHPLIYLTPHISIYFTSISLQHCITSQYHDLTMPHASDIASRPTSTHVSADVQPTPDEKAHLSALLSYKLRSIPKHHIPEITLHDVFEQTQKTNLANIPPDINLMFFLRNRSLIDDDNSTPLKDERDQASSITRAIFFYRLSPLHQFQRYHDAARWNIAIFTALLTQHFLSQRIRYRDQKEREYVLQTSGDRSVYSKLTPAAVRFMQMYLAAVIEHHNAPAAFQKREDFIKLWKRSVYELFSIHASWARKALQRAMKQLSLEWETELDFGKRQMGKDEYDVKVGRFVGSIVPGRVDEGSRPIFWAGDEGTHHEGVDRKLRDVRTEFEKEKVNGLLDALTVPCPARVQDAGGQRTGGDEERTTVCELRIAVGCVQNIRPRDMLPVLMRFFSSAGHH